MHQIEPHFRWRNLYIASEDRKSPFYKRQHAELEYSHLLYNFYLHPQWDAFGSNTLYLKLLYADYVEGFALIELIGEWNDALHNDIMLLKRRVVEPLIDSGISKFVFFCENVLNYHAALEQDYYEEWAEELAVSGGWTVLINTRHHVEEEMASVGLQRFLFFGVHFNHFKWQPYQPRHVFDLVEALIFSQPKKL